jgi:hypothetical protein
VTIVGKQGGLLSRDEVAGQNCEEKGARRRPKTLTLTQFREASICLCKIGICLVVMTILPLVYLVKLFDTDGCLVDFQDANRESLGFVLHGLYMFFCCKFFCKMRCMVDLASISTPLSAFVFAKSRRRLLRPMAQLSAMGAHIPRHA